MRSIVVICLAGMLAEWNRNSRRGAAVGELTGEDTERVGGFHQYNDDQPQQQHAPHQRHDPAHVAGVRHHAELGRPDLVLALFRQRLAGPACA